MMIEVAIANSMYPMILNVWESNVEPYELSIEIALETFNIANEPIAVGNVKDAYVGLNLVLNILKKQTYRNNVVLNAIIVRIIIITQYASFPQYFLKSGIDIKPASDKFAGAPKIANVGILSWWMLSANIILYKTYGRAIIYIANPKHHITWNRIEGIISCGNEPATVHETIIPIGGTNQDA